MDWSDEVEARLDYHSAAMLAAFPKSEVAADIRAALEEIRRLGAERDEWKQCAHIEAKGVRCAFKERAERFEAALAEWRKHDSAPDCVACAVLDAATCGTLRVEDLLDGLPRLSTEDEVREIVDGTLVRMRVIHTEEEK